MAKKRIDPICGMAGTIPAHDEYFCSDHCANIYAAQNGLSNSQEDSHVPATLLVSFLVIGVIVSVLHRELMLPFMGIVLTALAILKLLDVRGFANAFQMYDLIGKRSRAYALVYPFIELAMGLSFLFVFGVLLTALLLLVLTAVSAVSVVLALRSGRKLQCACMGTKIKVPLTMLTLTVDIIMLIVALMVLFW